MPNIILPEKCGWFYILRLRHNNIWGFGITENQNIKNYLIKRYINPGANKGQVFDFLYYGKMSQIRALEKHIKNEWSEHLLILHTEKLEWFDPIAKMTGPKIVDFVEARCKNNYSEIFRVKKKFLPFEPDNSLDKLRENADNFLEIIG